MRDASRVIESSFLRRADPRTKLALACAASAAVALPLPSLLPFAAGFMALLGAAGLTAPALAALRRMAVPLLVLFALDWMVGGPGFAVLITVRLALLATAGVVFVATTTPEELCQALERLGLPRRLAFTIAIACRSIDLLADEWRGILEAQRARGATPPPLRWRTARAWLAAAPSLLVPAVVLAAQRAWSLSEAAVARGLESRGDAPAPRGLTGRDHVLLAGVGALLLGLFACR